MNLSCHPLKMPRSSGGADLSLTVTMSSNAGCEKGIRRPRSLLSHENPGVPAVQTQALPYFPFIPLTWEAAHGSRLAYHLLEEPEVHNCKRGTMTQCSASAPVLPSPPQAPTAEKLRGSTCVPSSVSGIQCSTHCT